MKSWGKYLLGREKEANTQQRRGKNLNLASISASLLMNMNRSELEKKGIKKSKPSCRMTVAAKSQSGRQKLSTITPLPHTLLCQMEQFSKQTNKQISFNGLKTFQQPNELPIVIAIALVHPFYFSPFDNRLSNKKTLYLVDAIAEQTVARDVLASSEIYGDHDMLSCGSFLPTFAN